MGCATSKIPLQSVVAPNKDGPPYRYWLLRHGCSKIQDISVHVKKNGDDATLLMKREPSLSDHHLLHQDYDNRSSVDHQLRQSVSSNCSISKEALVLSSKEDDNKSILIIKSYQETKIEDKKENLGNKHKQRIKEFDQQDEENDEGSVGIPRSLSFKVYVVKFNNCDKIDDYNKSADKQKVIPNEDTFRSPLPSIDEDIKHVEHETHLSSMRTSDLKEEPSRPPMKTRVGNALRRVIPKSKPDVMIKSIFGASGCYNAHQFKPLSKCESKPTDLDN